MHYKLLLASLVGASTVLAKPIDLPKRERCDHEGGGSDCIVGMEVSTVTDIYTILVPKEGSGATGGVKQSQPTDSPAQGDGSNAPASAAPTNPSGPAPTAAATQSVAGSSGARSSGKGPDALSPKLSTTVFQSTLTPTETTVIVDAVETDVVFLTTVVDVFESGASTGKSAVSSIKSTITSTAVTTVPSSSVLTVQASTVFITVTDVITNAADPAPTSAKASSSSVASSKATGSSSVASSKAASSSAASTKAAVSSTTKGDKVSKPTSSQASESTKASTSLGVLTNAYSVSGPFTPTVHEKTVTETSVTGTTVITEEVTIFTTIELGPSTTSVAKVVSTSVTSVPLVTVVKTFTTQTTLPPTATPALTGAASKAHDSTFVGSNTLTTSVASARTTSQTDPKFKPSTASGASVIATPTDSAVEQSWLKPHNAHRRNHQAKDLTWDDNLARLALEIAQSCKFEHNMGLEGQSYGQNIFATSLITDPNAADDAVQDWYGEEAYYNQNNLWDLQDPPSQSKAEFEKYGHFTQLSWASTTKIGCAAVSCPNGLDQAFAAGGTFAVCNYGPPGNFAGQYKDNVKRPTN